MVAMRPPKIIIAVPPMTARRYAVSASASIPRTSINKGVVEIHSM
jgi:hypothetical protein